MWEEICYSFRGLEGRKSRKDHPDVEVAKGLVKRFWESSETKKGSAQQLRERGAWIEPAWDGLAIEVGGDVGTRRWKKVLDEGTTGGWSI